ncbi:MAG: type II toxin-antitoxin system HicB family antitoxin [Nanoarchaeota archaeon]|nr:type II toxin-antitoxin system HicB family antitoxin [Nanoarchaeota archaeon]MBU4352154.1 type II toxin-antitoxin system HicB family antitoxin [Nanoarchaeota archaeon]
MKEFNVLIEKGEDGYLIAEVVGLPGCHTQAKSLDQLMKRVKEAISLYLKCQKEAINIQDTFIGVQKVTMPAC